MRVAPVLRWISGHLLLTHGHSHRHWRAPILGGRRLLIRTWLEVSRLIRRGHAGIHVRIHAGRHHRLAHGGRRWRRVALHVHIARRLVFHGPSLLHGPLLLDDPPFLHDPRLLHHSLLLDHALLFHHPLLLDDPSLLHDSPLFHQPPFLDHSPVLHLPSVLVLSSLRGHSPFFVGASLVADPALLSLVAEMPLLEFLGVHLMAIIVLLVALARFLVIVGPHPIQVVRGELVHVALQTLNLVGEATPSGGVARGALASPARPLGKFDNNLN